MRSAFVLMMCIMCILRVCDVMLLATAALLVATPSWVLAAVAAAGECCLFCLAGSACGSAAAVAVAADGDDDDGFEANLGVRLWDPCGSF